MKEYVNMVSEKERGAGVEFHRIRRITGYLVGSLDRFNSAKRAEVADRTKHMDACTGASMTSNKTASVGVMKTA